MNTGFLDYVKKFSKDELIETIDYIYRSIKGTSNLVPALGYNGCLEFSATLLLFKYLANEDYRYNRKLSEPAVLILSSIMLAFNGLPAGAISELTDGYILEFPQRLPMPVWNEVFCYFKENKNIDEAINRFEFASSRTTIADNNYRKTMQISNGGMDFIAVLRYSKSLGMVLSEEELIPKILKNNIL